MHRGVWWYNSNLLNVEYPISALLSVQLNKTSEERKLSSLVWRLSENTNLHKAEEATYPAEMFFSDVGGAAGLFLGLNVISIIMFVQKLGMKYYFS